MSNNVKKGFGQKLKATFGKRFRAGSYSAFSAAMLIAIVIVVNLIVGTLPSTQTQLDMSSLDLYTLSDQTKLIVSSVGKDLTMYLIANTGREDDTIRRLLQRYADLNTHVGWKTLDPNLDPTFLNNYDLSTSSLYENSVLVDCGGRYRLVGYDEIYVTTYNYDDYYGYNYSTSTSFKGENALTTAIHYVASDNLPKAYILSGHGEAELSGNITDDLEHDGFDYETVSLLTLDEIPEDAAMILINQPTSDLSEDEADLLIRYLADGGHVMLTTAYHEAGSMPNLMKVTERMGLTSGEGIVMEGDRNRRLSRYPYYLLPEMAETEESKSLVAAGYYILTPLAQPILETEGTSAEITWLLTTTESAYAKTAALSMTTTEKESGDTDGPFHVGAVSDLGGRLVWISADSFLGQYIDSTVSGGNSNLYMNYLNGMSGQKESISIRGKSLDSVGLTVPGASGSFWSIMMIGVIPAVLIATGIVILVRRKRR